MLLVLVEAIKNGPGPGPGIAAMKNGLGPGIEAMKKGPGPVSYCRYGRYVLPLSINYLSVIV